METKTVTPGKDQYWSGAYAGKPGPYLSRDVFVAVAGDTAVDAGQDPTLTVQVFWVPSDFDAATRPNAAMTPVTVQGSQERTVQCPLPPGTEFHVRARLVAGEAAFVTVYREFPVPQP